MPVTAVLNDVEDGGFVASNDPPATIMREDVLGGRRANLGATVTFCREGTTTMFRAVRVGTLRSFANHV